MYTLKIGYTEVFRTSQLDVLTTLIEDLLEHNEIPIRIEVNKAIEEKENG